MPPRLAVTLALSLLAAGCSDEEEDTAGDSRPPTAASGTDAPIEAAPADATAWFNEITHASGIGHFLQRNGRPDKLHISGPNGGGVALFDADDDGWLDVFLTTGSKLGAFADDEPVPTNRLYRNQGDGHFEDVTDAAELNSHGAWGQGLAVADVSGDGKADLFVANYGPNHLYLNESEPGAPRFTEGASAAGLDDRRWASAGAFFDPDRDGDLDLYVTHYIALDPALLETGIETLLLSEWQGFEVMKGPRGLPGEADVYFRNDGSGRFADATVEVGMQQRRPSFGFQPISTDYDLDGDADLFVSNDSTANYLWKNDGLWREDGSGKFRDVAVAASLGYDKDGNFQSCMGVAHEDINGDGFPDFFITNFSDELNVLYQSVREGMYVESTVASGLAGSAVILALGWGTTFLDHDNDRDLDLFLANGHVYPQADKVGKGYSYAQHNFLFHRGDPDHFELLLDAGPGLRAVHASRGAAVGDLDNDGDLDLVISNIDDHPTVLRNDTPEPGASVLIELRGEGLNRSAIGARVTVTANGHGFSRERRSSGSFMAHEDPRLHFGLGAAEGLDSISVLWSDGTEESVDATEESPLPAGHLLLIEKGRGVVDRRPLHR